MDEKLDLVRKAPKSQASNSAQSWETMPGRFSAPDLNPITGRLKSDKRDEISSEEEARLPKVCQMIEVPGGVATVRKWREKREREVERREKRNDKGLTRIYEYEKDEKGGADLNRPTGYTAKKVSDLLVNFNPRLCIKTIGLDEYAAASFSLGQMLTGNRLTEKELLRNPSTTYLASSNVKDPILVSTAVLCFLSPGCEQLREQDKLQVTLTNSLLEWQIGRNALFILQAWCSSRGFQFNAKTRLYDLFQAAHVADGFNIPGLRRPLIETISSVLLDTPHIATKGLLACGFLHALPNTGFRKFLLDYLHMLCINMPVSQHLFINLTQRHYEGVCGRFRNAYDNEWLALVKQYRKDGYTFMWQRNLDQYWKTDSHESEQDLGIPKTLGRPDHLLEPIKLPSSSVDVSESLSGASALASLQPSTTADGKRHPQKRGPGGTDMKEGERVSKRPRKEERDFQSSSSQTVIVLCSDGQLPGISQSFFRRHFGDFKITTDAEGISTVRVMQVKYQAMSDMIKLLEGQYAEDLSLSLASQVETCSASETLGKIWLTDTLLQGLRESFKESLLQNNLVRLAYQGTVDIKRSSSPDGVFGSMLRKFVAEGLHWILLKKKLPVAEYMGQTPYLTELENDLEKVGRTWKGEGIHPGEGFQWQTRSEKRGKASSNKGSLEG